MRALVIEDDVELARGLRRSLRELGFSVNHKTRGRDAALHAWSEPYNVVVLDLILPDISGLEVLGALRESGSLVPVLILTVRNSVRDRITGLNAGADDYLTKPFHMEEFEARVRALVRRSQGAPFASLTCGPLTWDRTASIVRLNGELLPLRPREQAVLIALMAREGKVVPKSRLFVEVFGFGGDVGPNALELNIARVRKRLGSAGPEIVTIPSIGYMLKAT
jgi:two-component system response regulator TctD